MFFHLLSRGQAVPDNAESSAYLIKDRWDDWGKYQTMFTLVVVVGRGEQHHIGSVKIGQRGLRPSDTIEPGQRAPEIEREFEQLEEDYFSLGQGETYYESLNELPEQFRQKILVGLRDVAFNNEIFRSNLNEEVMRESLLRSVRAKNVENRLHRLSVGDARLTRFKFAYSLPMSDAAPPANLEFDVFPDSVPPTNVHVLIGRNGVGKTRFMKGFTLALLGRDEEREVVGTLDLLPTREWDDQADWSFSGLIHVTFSAFDDFNLEAEEGDSIRAVQVGLHKQREDRATGEPGLKSQSDLAQDFRKSLAQCRYGLKAQRWREAVSRLETDDLFAESEVRGLLEQDFPDGWNEGVELFFRRLSSGHAIVLLTITRLVELVDEKTLVLIDEPEGHLHPPLLSAFVRCLSDLLVKRNGVAIISTHSPVVLQEVPRSCAWKLRRSRDVSIVERPTIETFGESVGLLTREVFGLEVTRDPAP
ncbi:MULTISPECIES: AAA family ATPase [Hyphobacterium]|uniref:AAA family ATPase n=1 Tax=Hyphobacterium vulgare TaxID=1736751 RepID=A0ABV6ZXB9_9PROT